MARPEIEGRKPQSPFERLVKRFKEIPSNGFRDKRQIKLDDGTAITMSIGRLYPTRPITHYEVDVIPNHLDDQESSFSVDLDGRLQEAEMPDLVLSVGGIEVIREEMEITMTDMMGEDERVRVAVAESLVDWLDGIIEKREYTKPPISDSIFR